MQLKIAQSQLHSFVTVQILLPNLYWTYHSTNKTQLGFLLFLVLSKRSIVLLLLSCSHTLFLVFPVSSTFFNQKSGFLLPKILPYQSSRGKMFRVITVIECFSGIRDSGPIQLIKNPFFSHAQIKKGSDYHDICRKITYNEKVQNQAPKRLCILFECSCNGL